MIKLLRISLLVTILAVGVWSGCTDRGTNVPARQFMDQIGAAYTPGHGMDTALQFQIGNPLGMLFMNIYLPEVALDDIHDGTPGKPVPAVILLTPTDSDQLYFVNHGLVEIANQLINDGTIQPMIIVSVTNHDKVFGGHFFAGHYAPAGNWDKILGKEEDVPGGWDLDALAGYLQFNFPIRGEESGSPEIGIGGVGQGAYGAFRAALLNKGLYRSISVTDGPLDFDGADDASGFLDWFPRTVEEQGFTNDTTINTTYYRCLTIRYDTSLYVCDSIDTTASPDTCFYSLIDLDTLDLNCADIDTLYDTLSLRIDTVDFPDSCFGLVKVDAADPYDSVIVDTVILRWVNKIDTASTNPVTRLFLGGALAFSPHDTAFTSFDGVISDHEFDTTFFVCECWNARKDSCITFRALDSAEVDTLPWGAWDWIYMEPSRFVIEDTETFVENIIGEADNNLDFHLPFDSAGRAYAPIWNLWLRENLEQILIDSSAAQLDGVNIWVASTPDASTRFGYYQQTQSWLSTLSNSNITVQTVTYTGYDGNPANGDQYLDELIRQMLIFHSESFGDGN